MAAKKLGDFNIGDVIKLNENGIPTDYILIHHGRPNGNYICENDAVFLLRKDIVELRVWNNIWNAAGSNHYPTSDIHEWLSNDMFSRYDKRVQDSILQIKIPYWTGGPGGSASLGNNGISCKIFVLAVNECLYKGDTPRLPQYGTARFSYFTSSSKAIANFNGKSVQHWTRDPDTQGYSQAWAITTNAGITNQGVSDSKGIRPVLPLPSDFIPNNEPTTPSSITIPDTIRGGEDTSVIWSASTDLDGNLDGYLVERSYNNGSSWEQVYQGRSTSTTVSIPFGTQTIMFRVCAYDTYGERSSWTTSPNRVVINNHAPSAPPSISVPLTPAGGESLSVTWTASTDADGNLEGYELERQWDGAGAFTQIYKGAALSFQDDIPKGEHTSVVYRVRAYDSFASYSSYTTSPSRTIDNNTAPVISCDLSGDLGEKSEGFSVPYTVSDSEQQEVTVIEKVGDLVKRTYKATLDEQNTFEVTGEYFQRILNGAQTVQIVATDSAGKSSTLELTFTKKVHKAVITLSEPLAVEEPITVAVLAITGKIPADATQLIELTNNGNDPTPNWEDATADVKAGRNYVFKNKTQTNGWAFNFRVTVERGESGEDGNIVSIQGGFQ